MSVLSNGFATTVVKTKTRGYVYIDTRYTFDCGWETMVFRCNKNGEVIDWIDLDVDRYNSREEADRGHYRMVMKWVNM